ncbi:LacI family DNA-binding transcriptional regulator [Mariniluteicoccus flavus]
MRVTIKDVAAAMGVSPATVSNAYNRPDQLSAALRERILAKATEIGYDGPNAAAHALRSGKAGAIGLLLSYRLQYAFSDPFAVGFLAGVAEACEASGTAIVLLPLASDDQAADLAALRRANVDGLTEICLLHIHDVRELARRREVPFVGTFVSPDYDHVAIDDERAGALLGEHLASLDHRRVAMVIDSGSPPDTPVRRVARLAPGEAWDQSRTQLDDMWHVRIRGLVAAMPDATIEVIQSGTNSLEAGRSAGAYVLDRAERPTAVVGASDVLALGVLDAMAVRGLRAPGDVSVCGIDDIPAAEAAGLTTVHQPIHEKGLRVGRLLLDPTLEPRQVVLPIHLVARETTGPAVP